MSEAIFAPTIEEVPDVKFDYAMGEPANPGTLRQRLKSGKVVQRGIRPDVRTLELIRKNASTDDVQSIREFHRKNRENAFLFKHPAYVFDGSVELERYFMVEWAADPQIANIGPNAWFIDLQLAEAVGAGFANQLLKNPSFNFWTGVNQPTDWTVNTDNTEEPSSNFTIDGSALEILADGTAGVGEVKQDVSALIKTGKLYTVSGRIRRNATWDTGVDFDLFGTALDTTGLQLALGSIPNGSWAYFSGEVSDGGLTEIVADTEFRIQANGSPTTAGKLWVDQLMLVEGNVAGHRLYPDDILGHPTHMVSAVHEGKVVAGSWTFPFNKFATDGQLVQSVNTDTTSKYQIDYFGFGFILSYVVAGSRGIFDVYLDDVKVATVDSWKSGASVLSRSVAHLNVPLGLHRITIQTTNTKNAAASGNTIGIDALEVLI